MYRYSQTKYSQLLLIMGCIRIGTLHDFRRTEHAQGIADPKEGKKEVFHEIEDLFVPDSNDPAIRSSKDMRALEAFRTINMTNSRNITFRNVTVSQSFDHPDCFVLCSSRTLSRPTMGQFQGADSCVQIVEIRDFYQCLTETLNSLTQVIFRGIHSVVYKDRKESWNGHDWGHHPALIKEPRFAKQAEIRALWEPQYGQPIQPMVIGDYRLTRYCRQVHL